MRKISKGDEAPELTQWRRHNPAKHYGDMGDDDNSVRRAIRRDCLKEQKGLCAFCCGPVSVDKGHNAHIRNQARYPHFSLNWGNIVASCLASEHCGVYQKRNDIPLTPLMPECESELKFYASGKVKALTPRAQITVNVLNLNDDTLRIKRKKALENFVYSIAFYPVEDIPNWDEETIHLFIAECDKEYNGVLAPYAPILANIIRQFL